ncbi:MAG: PAS domain-containing protein, partial [Ignavibacteriales bacterium]
MELNEEFRVEYENALKSYILDNQEIALNRAYELGRKSLQSGHSILDTARLNSELIFKILSETDNNNDKEQIVSSATMFFTEYLSPFVMTFKGFMDVVENLKREVSVRMQTEDTYRQSVNYYEALLRNALDIITILDKQGNMIFYNASVTRILGYSEDELLNKNVFEFIHPDDIDGVLELFNKAITIPSYTATTEFRFRHKKGDWVILESVGKNMLTDPDISGVIVNSRDVTDRRNLEEIRRKYEFIANASLELTGLINREYKYEAVNDAYCLALSRERSEIIGKSISEIFGRETFINSIKDKIDRAFKGSEIIYETWFTLPVLGKIYMELAYYPYKNKSNNVTHVVFRNRDITERKKREDEIKNSQIQLAEAQQIAHIGSWEWSTNSNTIWCSDELCRILGLDPDQKQISYKQFLSYVDTQDRKKLNIKMMNALNTSTPFIMEHNILIKGGISKILQTRGKVVFDENKLSSKLIGTSQDVTEQVFTQRAIKSSEIKYRRLFETSKEGIILLDASTGIISDINPFVTDLLGFPKENYVGKKLWETKAVKGIPDSEKAFRDIIKKGYARYEELELNTKSNKKVKIEFISIAYTVNSDKLIQCHLWDVTERKILQEKLNRSAKQRAEDLKKFAHSIQHAQEE